MNEFTAKKLGEVLAFCRVGIDTFQKGETALISVFADDFQIALEQMQIQAEKIEELVYAAGVSEITLKKAEGTGKKLISMRDLYVGDQWDNPAELCEWLGFFEGSAIVHFTLVEGAGEALGDLEIINVANAGIALHRQLLEKDVLAIKEIAKSKAQS